MLNKTVVVIPNWNGEQSLPACLDSLLAQTPKPTVLVVENGSVDQSLEILTTRYPRVRLIVHPKNLGFAGGVNAGIRWAIENKFAYVALFNNDAIAEKDWLEHLEAELDNQPKVGIVTGKLLTSDGRKIDSTGDIYTSWGLPYPRGRGEPLTDKYDGSKEIFAASGGASLYRVSMLKQIGLFDEDFFAYYEDVDISFRAQLAGWRVRFVPHAVAYHQIGASSSKIKGFTTFQTMKNLPLLWYKNVPKKYLLKVGVRLLLAQKLFLLRAISRGQGWMAFKGIWKAVSLLPTKRLERKKISLGTKVSDEYIWSIMVHDLPPNARALRSLRQKWWRLRGRNG